jgi:hypothetical protein
MRRVTEVKEELEKSGSQVESLVTQISHLAEIIQEEAFSFVRVDPIVLGEVRSKKADLQLELEQERARYHLIWEEYSHLVRGQEGGKKFGF